MMSDYLEIPIPEGETEVDINNVKIYPENSKYITNCLFYKPNFTITEPQNLCEQCIAEFIPTQDYTRCVSLADVPNCILADNVAGCKIC